MLIRLLVALVAGGVTAVAFEPFTFTPALLLGVLVLAGLLVALPDRRRGRWAYAVATSYGLGLMLTLLPWLHVVTPAWPVLALVQALLIGLVGPGVAAFLGRPWWPLAFAAVWTAVEVLRSGWPLGGFPWGRLAFATVDTPAAGLLPWLGAGGTTFVLALAAALVVWGVRALPRRLAVGVPALGVSVALVLLGAVLPSAPGVTDRPGDPVRVAAVQGNTPGVGLAAMAERRAVLDNHVRATRRLAAEVAEGREVQPDLVLWPENSSDIDPFRDAAAYVAVSESAAAIGAPLGMGTAVDDGLGWRNRFQVWDPTGEPVQSYDKQKAVPFGEYVPFRSVLQPLIPALDQIPRDMVPGERPGVLTLAGTPIGVIVCFEVAYAGLATGLVAEGAEILTVPTNNATYMGTAQVEQQFAMARLMATMTSRSVVVVSTNGVSGIVGPDGEVTERAPVRETAVLTAEVARRVGETPAVAQAQVLTLATTAPGAALGFASGVLLALGGRRARRREEPA